MEEIASLKNPPQLVGLIMMASASLLGFEYKGREEISSRLFKPIPTNLKKFHYVNTMVMKKENVKPI